MLDHMKRVLFICTGNYYRSRFAESLFDALARERGIAWEATSRGTSVLTLGHYNVGPLCTFAWSALTARNVVVEDHPRAPIQLTSDDFTQADAIVAICEEEHRPLLEDAFPHIAPHVEYWSVRDRAFTPPEEAFRALEQEVRRLVERLAEI
jgi:protein-tyrosine phosphatase